MQSPKILLPLVLVLVSIGTIAFHPVHAAGLVYVSPQNTAIGSIGSYFTVKVQVANMDPFDGWDIQIQSDPTVINATSLSIAGNIFEVNYTKTTLELRHCINGAPAGSSCDLSTDGPGVVHSAAVFFGLPLPQNGPSSGLLFTITYKVVGSGAYSPIQFLSAIITNPARIDIVVPQDGVYGTSPPQDFSLTVSTSFVTIRQGTNVNITLTISSIGNYAGVVKLTTVSSPSGLSLSVNASNPVLPAGQFRYVLLTASSNSSSSATTYTITVTGNSGLLRHRTILAVQVAGKADFILNASPSLLKVHATNSGSSIITLDTQSGFSGSIQLDMAVPAVPGLTASLGNKTMAIQPGSPARTVFNVRTPDSNFPFLYQINITATSGSLIHTQTIYVNPPSPDYTFFLGGTGFAVQAGQSRSFTLTMTSIDYFKGQLFLLATSLSGAKEVFSRPAVALDFGNYSTSTLTITTDASLAPGNHNIMVTALGTTFLGASVNHAFNITLTVTQQLQQSAAVTVLGLQPLAYFGIIGALWMIVIGAVIREVRKPKPKRFLS